MSEHLNILFIFDSEDDISPILQVLNSQDLNPSWEWVNTAGALRLLLTNCSWDVIISGYNLFELGVLTALTITKQCQVDVPFIVISDIAGERLAVEIIKAGAHDYLMRDDLTHLPVIIQNELREARLRSTQKQATSVLQEAESKYRAIYSNAIEGIYQSTPDGRYLTANIALAHLFGYGSPDILIAELNDIRHQLYVDPQRRDIFERIIVEQGYVIGFESQVYRQDDGVIWISENGRLVLNEQGHPSYYEGFVTDISDRKRLEAIQSLNQARATAAFEQATVGFVESNMQTGEFTFVNPYFCKITGYPQTELLRMTVSEITHPDDIEMSRQKIDQLLSGQIDKFKVEKRYLHKDGTCLWAETTVYLVHFGERRDTRCLAIIQDIGEKKRLESARKQADQERQGFFNLSQDLLCISTLHGRFTKLNPAWEITLGYSSHELIGSPFMEFVHPEDRRATLEELHSLSHSKTGIDFENRYCCKDGSYKWLAWRSIPDFESGLIYAIARDITDQKQTQQQLQSLNQELEIKVEERTKALAMTQSAVDLAADGVFLVRPNGSFYYVNNTACEKLGYTKDEFREMTSYSINPTIEADDWDEIWQILKRRSAITIESQHQSKSGHIYPIEINAKYLNFDGEEYCFSFVRDISDRKLAEATLQRENTFRLQIIENIAEGLCVSYQIDRAPFVYHTVWNRQMQAITGYSLEEINQLGVIPGLIPDGIEPETYVSSYMEQLWTEPTLIVTEAEIWRKDGQWRTVAISSSGLSNSEGQFTVLALIQDITERKQSEQSARLLADVVESTDDAIITKNLDGIITSWNSAAVTLFGYTESEAIGQSVSILFPSDHIDLEPQILERIKQGERIKNFETINLHKNGTPIEVSATISPLRNETGQIVGASKIIRDITERKRADMQLRLTNEELIRVTHLKDEFLANMSHELRTPLNAILGMTESLQEQVFGKIHEQQTKPLQMIRRSGTHLLELINDILDVAKIESGQMELELAPTEVNALCESSLDFVRQQAGKKNIHIEIKLPCHLPNVMIDRRRMRQVLINLLNNAVKFTPKGGRITLEVDLQPQDIVQNNIHPRPLSLETRIIEPQLQRNSLDTNASLQIAVSDTGIGIAPKHIDKLFQPFIQIDSSLSRKYSGTGLGLALVKRIVELHGGEVTVTSKVGLGSCFTVHIPYVAGPLIRTANESEAKSSIRFNPTEYVETSLIFLAKDREANAITILSYLRAKGYYIQMATSLQQFITLAQMATPDLILLDMPTLESADLEIAQQIRLIPNLGQVPIIALTNSTAKNIETRYSAIGVDYYLSKPLQLKQLISVMQQLL